MYGNLKSFLSDQLRLVEIEGLSKTEWPIAGPQGPVVTLADGRELLNFCANNYLGLSHHPDIETAAIEGIKQYGYGMSSVRFICGTQVQHTQLERKVSEFLGTDDTLLYSSCFDANGGLFETIFGPEDAVISDQLNHASIIDGIRLCKAKRYRYAHANMAELEAALKDAESCRFRLIVTDGVFSMDGAIAPLQEICALARQYEALVMVDDSHGLGVIGPTGRGAAQLAGVMDQIDIYTGTFGKAFGGASGGFTSGRQEIIDWLRQKSRPYLFSNSLAPSVVAASLCALNMVMDDASLVTTLTENTRYFRTEVARLGYTIPEGIHPIVPIMIGDAKAAKALANRLLDQGIYVVSFSYPVVPKETARIRLQLSAAFSQDHLDQVLSALKSAT